MPFDEEDLDSHGECRAEIVRLREALRPFAEFAEGCPPTFAALSDDFPISNGSRFARRQLTLGDCRKALAALQEGGRLG